jgi:hypothetical protein
MFHLLAEEGKGVPPFFWLHIKKAGGESFRKSFTPPYVQTDRQKDYKPFIALPREEWNDALNNYRIPLGEFDYRRMLFAKRFLYSEREFAGMFKFVIVRNPFDRAVSCWKYLGRMPITLCDIRKQRMRYSFERFLRELPNLWKTKWDRHFATHTAPMWPDISDESGRSLVDHVVKLENILDEIPFLNRRLNLQIAGYAHVNQSSRASDYRRHHTARTRELVESLYGEDIGKLGYTF